jgi:chemotaxis protein CheD
MNAHFNAHFDRKVVTIYPGEIYSSHDDEIISTVIGSCIAVALYDSKNQFGGLNHFMLAKENSNAGTLSRKELGCFGEYAISMLIDEMIKNGADYDKLVAKVFGGSSVLVIPSSGTNVCDQNTSFAFDCLKARGIPVIGSDTGGVEPRKIFFETKTARIWLKKLHILPDITDI